MEFTLIQLLRLGVLVLLAWSCFLALELKTKLQMLQSIQVVIHPESIKYGYINGERPNTVPIRLQETAMEVEWLDDEVYGLYSDDDWKSLFPFGDSGFITLGTPPADAKVDTENEWSDNVFAIGMYHQLHCLDVFRHSYVAAKAGVLVYPGNGTGFDHHINHCLSYMREMVLCNADSTLIHTSVVDGAYAATSIGTVHRCRDWTQLRKFSEEHNALRSS